MFKRFLAILLCLLLVVPVALADGLSVGDVNDFLNNSAKLGEGSKANQVAVIPFDHISSTAKFRSAPAIPCPLYSASV